MLWTVDLNFLEATRHWFFVRSSQTPTCVVEVATPEDVSVAVSAVVLLSEESTALVGKFELED